MDFKQRLGEALNGTALTSHTWVKVYTVPLSVFSIVRYLGILILYLVITSSCGVMAAGVLRIIGIYLSVGTAHAQP